MLERARRPGRCAAGRCCARDGARATTSCGAGRERGAQRRRGRACARTARWRCPGEAVTDPVAYTLALALPPQRHGAELRTGFRVAAIERDDGGLVLESAGGERVRCRVVVNCAGLHADEVARLAGDDSFEIYPRKGEFLVSTRPRGERLERILLPVPTRAHEGRARVPDRRRQGDRRADRGRPGRQGRLVGAAGGAPRRSFRKAIAMWPPLEGAEPIAAYAGLRPAGAASTT